MSLGNGQSMCIALTCATNTQRLMTFPWVLQVLQIAGSSNSTGSLPISWSALGSFLSLKVLNLAGASFTGSIPSSWVTQGAFPKMTYLSLANTTLTGAVPSFHTGQLAVLDLSFSGLSGNISDLWSSTSNTISAIGLTGVNVTGAFPYELPLFWKSLRTLVVDNTSITGTIPTSWLATASVERSPCTATRGLLTARCRTCRFQAGNCGTARFRTRVGGRGSVLHSQSWLVMAHYTTTLECDILA